MSVIIENEIEEKTKLCKLCFASCDKNFEVVDDLKRKMLETVLLDLDFSAGQEPVICMCCTKNVKKSCNFKMSCLHAEEFINSFSSDDDSNKLDLTKIYLNRTGNNGNVNLLEGHAVCRLCMELVKDGYHVPLGGDTKDGVFFNLHFPEINLNITSTPVICASCHASLRDYFDFMSLIAERKVQRICTSERVDSDKKHKGNLESELTIKNVKYEHDYAVEVCQEDIDRYEVKHEDLLNAEVEEVYLKSEPLGDNQKTVDCDSAPPPRQEKCMYPCPFCCLVTINNYLLQKHLSTHQKPQKIKFYECTICTFKSKYKKDLLKHFKSLHSETLRKDESKVKMFHCAECTFKTRYKGSIRYHVLIHKDPQVASKRTSR